MNVCVCMEEKEREREEYVRDGESVISGRFVIVARAFLYLTAGSARYTLCGPRGNCNGRRYTGDLESDGLYSDGRI